MKVKYNIKEYLLSTGNNTDFIVYWLHYDAFVNIIIQVDRYRITLRIQLWCHFKLRKETNKEIEDFYFGLIKKHLF